MYDIAFFSIYLRGFSNTVLENAETRSVRLGEKRDREMRSQTTSINAQIC
jgi:hypothetical protein